MWYRAEKVFLISELGAVGFKDHTVVLQFWGYDKVSFTPRIYRPMVAALDKLTIIAPFSFAVLTLLVSTSFPASE